MLVVRNKAYPNLVLNFINHQSSIQDFYDDDQITSVYYKEMHDVVKEETGADEVMIFSHITRNEAEAALGKRKGAHRLVHNDFTPSFEENHLSFLHWSLKDKPERITVYNLWRRFDKDGIDAPFALCDSRSVSEKELIPTDLYSITLKLTKDLQVQELTLKSINQASAKAMSGIIIQK